MGSDGGYQTTTAGDVFERQAVSLYVTTYAPDPSPFMHPCIDNDPNQTHAHRERRLMLEKQARRQANRRR